MPELIETFFNSEVFASSLPLLLRGLLNTMLLGVTVIVLGSAVGLAVVLLRLYSWPPVRYLAVLYIDIMRSLPSLVVLVFVYFALPFVGVTLSPFVAAALALSLVVAAYTAEICRAGIEAIPRGQFEAAAALGLSFHVVLRKVILPQALRIVTPPLISNAISALKETSIASVVATPDLLKMALDTQAQNANPTPLIGAAVIYLVVLWPLVKFGAHIEASPKLKQAR
ncbi:amino acid ABC transporter permease [Ensifer sp. ENS05]|uniref:amino acid ABC transporter permease n=1 Tax=Ensifer sp. ENS05 TaxID=2769277 RepID=UPI00177EF8FC|nr:amino acid ABC transporter permease [Ensifer sp. ENS05]MBD9597393.1 amino acid ABC transporter permease [Ensifer sp. ENS05]